MNYFKSRSSREQILISVMLGLLTVFAIWQFVINPVLTSRANAMQAQSTAQRDLSIVQNGLPRLTVSRAAPNTNAAPFDRGAIISTAREINIAISRVQPEANEAMKVWFEDTSSQKLYAFLSKISRDYKVEISRVNINRRSEGSVSAQITLVPII